MVKTDAEIIKVVRALTIMLVHSSTTFFSHIISPEDWIKGHEAVVKLVPGTSKDATKLAEFRIVKKDKVDCPSPNLTRRAMVPARLTELVGEVRKKFTSIHDIDDECLKFKLDKLPSEDDILWAETVSKTYGVDPSTKRQKAIVFTIDSRGPDEGGIADTGLDENNFIQLLNHFKDRFRIEVPITGYDTTSTIPDSKKIGIMSVKEY